MEKMQKKDMNRIYTLFSGEEISIENYAVQMVLHHMLEGLLYSSVYTLDQKQVWSCEHTDKISLAEYCEQHELDREELQWIYGGILQNLLEIQDFLLDTDNLYLNPSEIYLDVEKQKVWNCYVPFYRESVWRNLQELTQYLLGNLNQRDSGVVQIIYEIFRYLIQGGEDIEKIWKILWKKSEMDAELASEFAPEENIQQSNELSYTEAIQGTFRPGKWILAALSIALAVFLCILIVLNEWYLSVQRKMVLLIAAAGFGTIGVILWKRWGDSFRKENPLEKESWKEQDREEITLEKDSWKEQVWTGRTLGRDSWKDQDREEYYGEETTILGERQKKTARLVRKDTLEEFLISQNPCIIGKLPEVAQILLQESTISRIHAKISIRNEEYYLEDLNSKNGTYVNGVRLEPQKPTRIYEADELVFARTCCYLQL